MAFTTYVVDDESAARDRLLYLIDQFLVDDLEVVGQSATPVEAKSQVLQIAPEILFLDIEMPEKSGLELAKELQAEGFKGKIIFVSAYGHYSIKAIRANAFDYILKPVDVDELKGAIDRLKESSNLQLNKQIIESFNLSEREVDLVKLLSKGLSSEEIANELFLSRHTVDTHRRNIHVKTGTRNTVELLNLLRN